MKLSEKNAHNFKAIEITEEEKNQTAQWVGEEEVGIYLGILTLLLK